MSVDTYIDHNVWHFLYQRHLHLEHELPADEFHLCLTREAEFEIACAPPDVKAFMKATIQRCGITTKPLFGFADPNLPAEEQRVGGLDEGDWASAEELTFIRQQEPKLGTTKRPTKLYKNEADIALGARAFDAVILTLDAKRGPIKDAHAQQGKVVFLGDFDASGQSLRDFIKTRM
jgi:hypothetical protein